jgi:N-acetylmuramoyl-L-alanine amidase
MARKTPFTAVAGMLSSIWRAVTVRNAMPCVGVVILAGCLTLVIAPEDEPSVESMIAAEMSPRFTVVIDPGHGGRDEGARANGLVEKDLTLDLALRVEKLLKSYEFPTVMTRRDNSSLSLAQRVSIANRTAKAIVLSLHFNHDASGAGGVETFYAKNKVAPESTWNWIGFFSESDEQLDTGESLAGYIQAAMSTRLEARNRGIRGRELYMVRHTRAPAVLIEGGFLSNPFEARLLSSPAYLDRMAAAIVEGVLTYQKQHPHTSTPPQMAKLQR